MTTVLYSRNQTMESNPASLFQAFLAFMDTQTTMKRATVEKVYEDDEGGQLVQNLDQDSFEEIDIGSNEAQDSDKNTVEREKLEKSASEDYLSRGKRSTAAQKQFMVYKIIIIINVYIIS